MKKTKKLASALIGALTMSMTLGGFVAPAALAASNQDMANNPPPVIYCDEHPGENHFIITSVFINEKNRDLDWVYYDRYEADSENATKFTHTHDDSDYAPGGYVSDFGETPVEGTIYVEWCIDPCHSYTIPTCDHTDLTHHEAVAGTDCQHNGTIEYWQCNNEDCGKMFSDEACTTEVFDVTDTVDHNTRTFYNDNYHWESCINSGCYRMVSENSHQFGTDTSQISYFTCECGYENYSKFTSYANTAVETACKNTMAEIESYNFAAESVAAYKTDVNRVPVTFAETIGQTTYMADGKAALESALNELASIREAALSEQKSRLTKNIDITYKANKDIIEKADVHEIVKIAALASLDEIVGKGKESVAAAETKNLALDAYTNTIYSEKALSDKVQSFKTFELLDGEDSTMVQNSDDIVKIRVDAAFEDFAGVTVDGILVAPENYTVESGSTIVTFNNDYLNTLAAGNHIVGMYWFNGMSTSNLTIKAAPAPVIIPRTVEEPKADDAGIAPLALDPVADKKAEVKADAPAAEIPAAEAEAVKTNEIPSTGDSNETALWVLAMVVAVTAGSGVVANRKKKSR